MDLGDPFEKVFTTPRVQDPQVEKHWSRQSLTSIWRLVFLDQETALFGGMNL